MLERLIGTVETGSRNANVWLATFNAEYSRKLAMPVYAGTLNLRLTAPFDWADPGFLSAVIRFDRGEYGGERDILLLPCRLESLHGHRAFLWTTTTPRLGADRLLIEIVADIPLPSTFGLEDGQTVTVDLILEEATPE